MYYIFNPREGGDAESSNFKKLGYYGFVDPPKKSLKSYNFLD